MRIYEMSLTNKYIIIGVCVDVDLLDRVELLWCLFIILTLVG